MHPPPTAEIQKSWRKVDFPRISGFREAGNIYACLFEAVKNQSYIKPEPSKPYFIPSFFFISFERASLCIMMVMVL